MPLAEDTLLGKAYINVEEFRPRAGFFGVGMSMCDYPATTEGDNALITVLAGASRMIDTVCGRNFIPDNISENHAWNPKTKRIKVNAPPVMELVQYKIRTAPGLVSTFNVSDVYINNQENYLELTSLSVASSLTTPLLTLGMNEAQVEIIYKSYQDVPNEVKMACGYQAAHMINESFVNKTLPPGFGSIQIGGMKVNNNQRDKFTTYSDLSTNKMSPVAKQLLGDYIRIPVG